MLRLERILAGTAIALVLALSPASLGAQTLDEAAIDAAIPVPEPADVPPPTLADVGGPTTSAAAPSATEAAPPAVPPKELAAPEPSAPAVQQVVVSPDQPVIDALRELIPGKLARIIERKAERAAVEAFYNSRAFAPIWIENGAANERAKAAIAHLAAADADGLDPADYATPVFRTGAEPAALAEAEIRLTAMVLTYARHAQVGRMHFSRVSADIGYTLNPPDPVEVLVTVAAANNVRDMLGSYNPPHAAYKALKAKLAEARAHKGEAGPVRIPGGPVLKVITTKATKNKPAAEITMQDNRVPLLRERLGVEGDANDTTYDRALSDAVAKFQKQKGLGANGYLNTATIEALNGPRRDRDAEIIVANMERWRWLPRDLGKAHVVLNIPEYMLRVYRDGAVIWQTRVVVGKPSTPTPILTETMKFITVNPTWNVPPSIIYNEYLPAYQQDPTVLERMGLKLTQNRDGTVHISQPPGERNALGRIRFNFPNKFLVYQHDTPDKHLFAHDKRAYSHGCMRVMDPVKYGEVLLSIALPKEGYTQERLRKMFGNSEVDIRFPTPIPVHITYQTASVDEAGKLVIRDDIYGRDTRTLAAIKNEDRRFADVPVERTQANHVRPVRLNTYASEQSFFDRLFGNPIAPPPAPINRRRSVVR
jgi:L,D-transpeptidase YcbB